MQTEARVGVVVEGGGQTRQRSLSSVHGGARNYSTEQQELQQGPQIGAVPNLLAGGVAGAVSKTCTAPLARLTILFQVQGMHSDVATLSKTGIWREVYRILNEEGVRAFWRGNMLLRMVPGLDKRQDNASADVLLRLLGGGLAGITAATITYPLDLVRTRLAAQTKHVYYRGMSHALYAICRDEGVRGLYKGLGATLLGVGPSIAISFSVYDTLKSHWRSVRPQDSPVLVSLACGSLSGIASSTATFPLDLVRRRKQLEGVGGRACVYKSGLLGTFQHIVRTEGFRG